MIATAQQAATPVIGYLGSQSADVDYKNFIVPFLLGLKETSYVEHQNVEIDTVGRKISLIDCRRSLPISFSAASR